MKNQEKFNKPVLAFYDFEDKNFPYQGNLIMSTVKNGTHSFKMDTGMPFSPGVNITYGDLTKKPQVGIRMSAWVYSEESYTLNPANFVITSNHDGLTYRYESLFLEKENLSPGTWNFIIFDYITPEYPDPKDVLQAYIWYRGNKELYVDDLKIELFEPKE